jgi:hypothetical protein
MPCMPGKARPEVKSGSEEPDTSEAAVAAVATLSNVPRTSILVGESDNGRDAGTGVSSCTPPGCCCSCDVSLVALDTSWFSLSVLTVVSDDCDSGAA